MEPSEGSLLSKLERKLEPQKVSEKELADATAQYEGLSEGTLRSKIQSLLNTASSLVDGGEKARKQCQIIQAVLDHRPVANQSKQWLQLVG